MKSCPACKTQYSDDTLQFCLQDGTPLTWTDVPETPTIVLGETETVVSRGAPVRVNIPIGDPNTPAWQPSQVTSVATAMPEKKGSNTVLAIGLTAIGMLVLFGIIGIAALVFMQNRQQAGAPNTNVFSSNTNYNSIPTPFATSTPVRTPTPIEPTPTPRASPPVPPEPPPLALKSYPSTTRLKFGRGSFTTSFSGEINPGDSRSLVLACRSGQSLSASVSSSSGCARLRGGGSSLMSTTTGGDNYVSVTNNCSSVVFFSVRVSVF